MSDMGEDIKDLREGRTLPALVEEAGVPAVVDQEDEDVTKARIGLMNVVEVGTEAMTGLQQLCAETEHPKAYETLAKMMVAVSDASYKLAKLRRAKRDNGGGDDAESMPRELHNHLHVQSTADLLRERGKES